MAIQDLVRRWSPRKLYEIAKGAKLHAATKELVAAFPEARRGDVFPQEGRAYLFELAGELVAREREFQEKEWLRSKAEAGRLQLLREEFVKGNPKPNYPPCVDTENARGDVDVLWWALLPNADLRTLVQKLASDLQRWVWRPIYNDEQYMWTAIDTRSAEDSFRAGELSAEMPRYPRQVVEWAMKLGAQARLQGVLFEDARRPPSPEDSRPARTRGSPRIKRVPRPR
ncbi:MAG: hypothetical protein EOO71_24525 [Myxococcaceae bacterium]|nr:MAG: hypothetical protein EOO71_24525 [Myxococcaceae bacterium]